MLCLSHRIAFSNCKVFYKHEVILSSFFSQHLKPIQCPGTFLWSRVEFLTLIFFTSSLRWSYMRLNKDKKKLGHTNTLKLYNEMKSRKLENALFVFALCVVTLKNLQDFLLISWRLKMNFCLSRMKPRHETRQGDLRE